MHDIMGPTTLHVPSSLLSFSPLKNQVDVVSSRSRKYVCEAFPAGPINVIEYVTSLSDAPNPPNGVWTTGRGSILSTQSIVELPSSRRLLSVEGGSPRRALVASGYPTALRQETSEFTI